MSAVTTDWTVRRILEWTTAHLKQHGSETPRLEAEILLAHARGCPRIRLYTEYDVVLTEDVRARMRELVKRRAAHEPVAYLVGQREFFSLNFEVNSSVLIPRPDTETLALSALEWLKERPNSRVLDCGTGSGCVAVTLAVRNPTVKVTAVDISPDALAVAKRNAARHQVSERIEFVQADLFPAQITEKFNLIVSNPPYIGTAEIETLAPEVRDHEPRLALDGGTDGLGVMRRLVDLAPSHLEPHGRILLEISPEQADAVEALLTSDSRWQNVRRIPDLTRRVRVVEAEYLGPA